MGDWIGVYLLFGMAYGASVYHRMAAAIEAINIPAPHWMEVISTWFTIVICVLTWPVMGANDLWVNTRKWRQRS